MSDRGDDGFQPHPGDPWHPGWSDADDAADTGVPPEEAPPHEEPTKRRGLFRRRREEAAEFEPDIEDGADEQAPEAAVPDDGLPADEPPDLPPPVEAPIVESGDAPQPAWLTDAEDDADPTLTVDLPAWASDATAGAEGVDGGFAETEISEDADLEDADLDDEEGDDGSMPAAQSEASDSPSGWAMEADSDATPAERSDDAAHVEPTEVAASGEADDLAAALDALGAADDDEIEVIDEAAGEILEEEDSGALDLDALTALAEGPDAAAARSEYGVAGPEAFEALRELDDTSDDLTEWEDFAEAEPGEAAPEVAVEAPRRGIWPFRRKQVEEPDAELVEEAAEWEDDGTAIPRQWFADIDEDTVGVPPAHLPETEWPVAPAAEAVVEPSLFDEDVETDPVGITPATVDEVAGEHSDGVLAALVEDADEVEEQMPSPVTGEGPATEEPPVPSEGPAIEEVAVPGWDPAEPKPESAQPAVEGEAGMPPAVGGEPEALVDEPAAREGWAAADPEPAGEVALESDDVPAATDEWGGPAPMDWEPEGRRAEPVPATDDGWVEPAAEGDDLFPDRFDLGFDDGTSETDPVRREAFVDDGKEQDGGWVTEPIDIAGEPTEVLPPDYGELEHLSDAIYRASATQEHRGLAEEIFLAGEEETEWQAVSAAMPGVETGVVGFDDVADLGTGDDYYEAKTRSDIGTRILTGVVLAGFFLGSLWVAPEALAGFIGIILLLGLGELFATLRRRGLRPLPVFGFLGAIALLVTTWFHGPVAIVATLSLTTVVTFFVYAFSPLRQDALTNGGLTVLGVAWVVGTAAFAYPILSSEDYRILVLAIVAVTAAMDIGAYGVGRAWGARALAPVLSPNKSVEGLVGGVGVCMVVAAAVGSMLKPFDLMSGIGLGIVVAIAAPLGDLAESMVKRSLGVKDMGSILPGHGGILDRIDALLFVIPAAWVFYMFAGLLG